jgi:hypothetical protein
MAILNKKARKYMEQMKGLDISMEGDFEKAYMDVHSCMTGKGLKVRKFYSINGVKLATLTDSEGTVVARTLYNEETKTHARIYGVSHYLLEKVLKDEGFKFGKILPMVVKIPYTGKELVKYKAGERKTTVKGKRIPLHAKVPEGAYDIKAVYRVTPYQYTTYIAGAEGAKYCWLDGYKTYSIDFIIPVMKSTRVRSKKYDNVYMDDHRVYVKAYDGEVEMLPPPKQKAYIDELYYEQKYFGAKYQREMYLCEY